MSLYIFAFPDIFAKYRNFAKHPSLCTDGKITDRFVFPDFLISVINITLLIEGLQAHLLALQETISENMTLIESQELLLKNQEKQIGQ